MEKQQYAAFEQEMAALMEKYNVNDIVYVVPVTEGIRMGHGGLAIGKDPMYTYLRGVLAGAIGRVYFSAPTIRQTHYPPNGGPGIVVNE